MHIARESVRRVPVLLTLVLSASLFLPGRVWGQVSVALQTGTSLTTGSGHLDAFEDPNAPGKFGFATGFALRASGFASLKGKSGLQLGVSYMGKRMDYRIDQYYGSGSLELTLGLSYVEFPLLYTLSLLETRAVTPRVALGPTVSVLVSCAVESMLGAFTISLECPNPNVISNLVDIGATASAGIDVTVSRFWSVSVDLQYNHGFSSVHKQDELKSRAFSLLVGVAVPIRCQCR